MERSEWSDDDASGFRPPLPPDDRLWRHPSEIGAGVQPAGATLDLRPRRRRTRTLVATGSAGMLLAAGAALWLVRPGSGSNSAAASSTLPPTSLLVTTLTVRAGTTMTGVLKLVAHTAAGDRAATAVAVDDQGTLVTTAAAVQDADTLEVVLPDGSKATARLLGIDAAAGAAVLRVEQHTSAALTGRAATLKPGAEVATPGPARMTGKVTGLGVRSESADGQVVEHQVAVELPGGATVAEGEPLMDDSGQVVALCGNGKDGEVRGVPIELARAAARSLNRHGTVRISWLGISGRDATRADGGDGAQVEQVKEGSPAALAGVRVGDRVVAIEGMAVASMASLVLAVRDHDPGSEVALELVRDGNTVTVKANLMVKPA
ncbi:MAG TPA: S1C family serine protease [Acidimicrobiales bacterium]